jgi:hypothetical protein
MSGIRPSGTVAYIAAACIAAACIAVAYTVAAYTVAAYIAAALIMAEFIVAEDTTGEGCIVAERVPQDRWARPHPEERAKLASRRMGEQRPTPSPSPINGEGKIYHRL